MSDTKLDDLRFMGEVAGGGSYTKEVADWAVDEIERLRRWKLNALAVSDMWEKVWDILPADYGLVGEWKPDIVIRYILELRQRLNDAQERYIEASNPGIDMAEVESIRDGGECRAARWDGTPVISGPHESHFFTYGPNRTYTGRCAGRS